MIRIVCFCAVMAVFTAAQSAAQTSGPASLAALAQTAQQKKADWDRLAQNLDTSILALLPCDPKAAAAITEVSKASEARVAAMAAYLQEAGRQAALQAAAARTVLASVEPLGPDLAIEKLDLAQEQLGVNGQIAALSNPSADASAGASANGAGGQRRPSFSGVQDALRQIMAQEQQRSDAVDSATRRADLAAGAMRDMVTQLVAREAALKEAQAAFETEGSRWTAYYTARLARAQTECNVTKGVVAAPPKQGKQSQGKKQ
jgi:hypothetical protein